MSAVAAAASPIGFVVAVVVVAVLLTLTGRERVPPPPLPNDTPEGLANGDAVGAKGKSNSCDKPDSDTTALPSTMARPEFLLALGGTRTLLFRCVSNPLVED